MCIWDVATAKKLRTFESEGSLAFYRLALSADEKWLVTFGTSLSPAAKDGYLMELWEVATGRRIALLDSPMMVNSIAVSSEGKWVVAGLADIYQRDYSVRLWDGVTGKQVRIFRGHSSPVNAVALSADGQYVLSGSDDKTVRMWSLVSGKQVRVFRGHRGEVSSLAVTSDGKHLFTGSWDQTTRLWDIRTGEELCQLISFRDSSWAVIDRKGRYDSSNQGNTSGLHWILNNEVVLHRQLKNSFYDPGLLAKYLGQNKRPFHYVDKQLDLGLFPTARITPLKAVKGGFAVQLTNRGGGIGKVQVFVNGVQR